MKERRGNTSGGGSSKHSGSQRQRINVLGAYVEDITAFELSTNQNVVQTDHKEDGHHQGVVDNVGG